MLKLSPSHSALRTASAEWGRLVRRASSRRRQCFTLRPSWAALLPRWASYSDPGPTPRAPHAYSVRPPPSDRRRPSAPDGGCEVGVGEVAGEKVA